MSGIYSGRAARRAAGHVAATRPTPNARREHAKDDRFSHDLADETSAARPHRRADRVLGFATAGAGQSRLAQVRPAAKSVARRRHAAITQQRPHVTDEIAVERARH